jgi:peptide deformylase
MIQIISIILFIFLLVINVEGEPKVYKLGNENDEITLRKLNKFVSLGRLWESDPLILKAIDDTHAALYNFRKENGFGRAIAAPQVGHNIKLIALQLNEKMLDENGDLINGGVLDQSILTKDDPIRNISIFNPSHILDDYGHYKHQEMFTMFDDCLSHPTIMVCVQRLKKIEISFFDEFGQTHEWENIGQSMSELLQHEMDHLTGNLAIDKVFNPMPLFEKNKISNLIVKDENVCINEETCNDYTPEWLNDTPGLVSRDIYFKNIKFYNSIVDYSIE